MDAKKVVGKLNYIYRKVGRNLYADGFAEKCVAIFQKAGTTPYKVATELDWRGLGPVLGGYDGIYGRSESMGVGRWFWKVAPDGWDGEQL